MSEPSWPGVSSRQRLGELCAAEGAFFFRLAWGILRDRHAAEDACQQAFVRAWAASLRWPAPVTASPGQEGACPACATPPDPARLRPWLARVVVNESLQVLRRRKRERRGLEREPESAAERRPLGQERDSQAECRRPDDPPGPKAEQFREWSPARDETGGVPDKSGATPDADRFLRPRVLAALEQLPEPTRLVVVLRIMQGWSGNEVKELLGCSAAEVSRRLYQGMEQLRGLLAEQPVEGRV